MPQSGFVGQVNKAEDRMADRLKDRESVCGASQAQTFLATVPREKGSMQPQ